MTLLSIWLFVKSCIVTSRSSLSNGGFDYAQPPGRCLSEVEGGGVKGRGSLSNGGFNCAQPPGRCLSVVEGREVEGNEVEGRGSLSNGGFDYAQPPKSVRPIVDCRFFTKFPITVLLNFAKNQ